MSNPTLLVESFDGSLGDFTGVEPIRFVDGLWLEEATTNYARNPSGEQDDGKAFTGWANGASVAYVTDEALYGDQSFEIDFDGSAFGLMSQTATPPTATGTIDLTASVAMKKASGSATIDLNIQLFYDSDAVNNQSVCAVTSNWQRFSHTLTQAVTTDIDAAIIRIMNRATGAGTDDTIYADGLQLERKPYATSYADYTMGAGYGGSYGKPSTRAASSASVPTAGHIAPGAGALAFRATPTIETSAEEVWGECGVKGAATDHVQWGRDSSKHPFVEWSSNNAAYQRLTGSETLNAGTRYFGYLDWTGTAVRLQIDANTVQTGSRAAVSDSFGAGELTLKATAGGAIYSPFATFDRLLTDAEVAALRSQNNWTLGTVTGVALRRIRSQFQLRPY